MKISITKKGLDFRKQFLEESKARVGPTPIRTKKVSDPFPVPISSMEIRSPSRVFITPAKESRSCLDHLRDSYEVDESYVGKGVPEEIQQSSPSGLEIQVIPMEERDKYIPLKHKSSLPPVKDLSPKQNRMLQKHVWRLEDQKSLYKKLRKRARIVRDLSNRNQKASFQSLDTDNLRGIYQKDLNTNKHSIMRKLDQYKKQWNARRKFYERNKS